jgi:hypothetical protein
MQVRAGNPVRPMLAQRLSEPAEILAKLGGTCAAEYKYDGIRVQAHRTTDGALELYTRRLDRVSSQFPEVVKPARPEPGTERGDPGGRGGGLRRGARVGRARPVAEVDELVGGLADP